MRPMHFSTQIHTSYLQLSESMAPGLSLRALSFLREMKSFCVKVQLSLHKQPGKNGQRAGWLVPRGALKFRGRVERG